MRRLRIEEDSLDHDVWGNLIDVEVADEGEELIVLEVAKKYVSRRHRVMHDGKPIGKTIAERIRELKERGVKKRRRRGDRR